MATISTHKDVMAKRAHNIRDPRVLSKLEHVNPELSNRNIVLIDEEPRAAYERIFGESVRKYNEKQKRTDRKITDYYGKICKDKKHFPVYEMLVGVYPNDKEKISEQERIEIIKEFYERFRKENPCLEVIGAYIHLDETNPHMHLDFVPVGEGYTRGMEKQCSMGKALENQGYESKSFNTPAVQIWNAQMNQMLEKICNEHGIHVEHPDREKDKVEHLETQLFKVKRETENFEKDLQKERDNFSNERLTMLKQLKDLENERRYLQDELEQCKRTLQAYADGLPYVEPIKERKDSVIISKEDFESLKEGRHVVDFAKAASNIANNLGTLNYKEYRDFKDNKDDYQLKLNRAKQSSWDWQWKCEDLNKKYKEMQGCYDVLKEKTRDYCIKTVLDDYVERGVHVKESRAIKDGVKMYEIFGLTCRTSSMQKAFDNVYYAHKDKYEAYIQEDIEYEMER